MSHFSLLPRVIIVSFCLILTLALAACERRNTGIAPGEQAPSFELPLLSGGTLSSSELARKSPYILNFWASWCGPCIEELPSLERLYQELKPRGGTVIAVGIDDDVNALRDIVKRQQVTFPVVVDTTGLKVRYDVRGVPETFLINKAGELVMIIDPRKGPLVRLTGPKMWDREPMKSLVLTSFFPPAPNVTPES